LKKRGNSSSGERAKPCLLNHQVPDESEETEESEEYESFGLAMILLPLCDVGVGSLVAVGVALGVGIFVSVVVLAGVLAFGVSVCGALKGKPDKRGGGVGGNVNCFGGDVFLVTFGEGE